MSSSSSRAARIGGGFDRSAELLARLQQGPGPEAQQQIEPTPTGPPPSRWTLGGIRATFAWLDGYTLSGVWRLLRRSGLRLRGAAVQQYSPDPEYRDKLERLLACLQEAAQYPVK